MNECLTTPPAQKTDRLLGVRRFIKSWVFTKLNSYILGGLSSHGYFAKLNSYILGGLSSQWYFTKLNSYIVGVYQVMGISPS